MGSLQNQEPNNGFDGTIKPLDPEEFRRHGHLVINFLADYYQNVEKYPVRSQVEPGYLKKRVPDSAPYDPEPIEEILRDVQKDIIPGITHWQSPNYFAYFPCNVSIPGFLGEMLSTGFNTVGFNWISSPAATELESIVMDWLGKMLKLPADFFVLQRRRRVRIRSNPLRFQKAAQIAGINPNNFRAVATTKTNAFGLTAEALRSTIESGIESGLVPLFLCATIGTTSSTAVDPLVPLCEVAKEYRIWVHIDAAYAGSACICPEYRHFLDGVENADSFGFNPHKWFLTTLDCCCLWVKHPSALVKALSTNPEYLRKNASETNKVVDYKDWQITLSRRFRSLKLWLVLRSYGVANLTTFLRSHVKMAQNFEGLVGVDKRFEVVVPRNFATVCFRISPVEVGGNDPIFSKEEATNNINAKLLESINESGKIYMTHAVIGGVYVMRFAVGASLTENRDVSFAWKVMQEHANAMLTMS
ncbi:hypothetical protein Pfo_027254 [Paulownia fortunei]|nr:hypothetical protein Pfo_027254 [Paulownia fortunei]